MREPSLRTSRLAIAGGLVAAIAVGAAGFYVGRTTTPGARPSAPTAATVAPQPPPSLIPTAEPILDRADIVELARLAADATASGDTVPVPVLKAVDRRFELAVPFGCNGPAEAGSEAPMRWRYDQEKEALRLHVEVTRMTASAWGLTQASENEAIEGFWIARPWSSSDQCPLRAGDGGTAGAESGATADRTLAVAQFFRDDVRREALREGRPFEAVERVARADFAAPRGFRLILSGRIDRVPGDGPVACIQPAGIEQRPRCIVAVTLDEVRIENPVSGEIIATWPIGRD